MMLQGLLREKEKQREKMNDIKTPISCVRSNEICPLKCMINFHPNILKFRNRVFERMNFIKIVS